jgi:hypothetical protein
MSEPTPLFLLIINLLFVISNVLYAYCRRLSTTAVTQSVFEPGRAIAFCNDLYIECISHPSSAGEAQ